MEIMYKMENVIWISIISTMVYLILPLLLKVAFPTQGKLISVLCVLLVNTMFVFIYSMLLTKKHGFSYLYAFTLGIIFIPCALFLYNAFILAYSTLYILLGLIASLIYFKYTNKIRL